MIPRLALGLALAASASSAQSIASGPSIEFVNGHWFTGSGFTPPHTLYAVNGVLHDLRPPRIDTIIDLGDGYVIPPFGDAHTHNLDGPANLDHVRDAYIAEGTFYVQVLTNTATGADAVRAQFNRPCALDVAYANGGLTSTLSHPFLAYEPRGGLGMYDGSQWKAHWTEIRASRRLENNAYWFIDSIADLDAKWPRFLASHPDLVKIFLLEAQEAPPVISDTMSVGHGLRPSLVPAIIRRAHAAGLRVAAHIETARDLAIVLDAGVDMLAHLPGYELTPPTTEHDVEISDDVARRIAARGIAITPTLSIGGLAEGADSVSLATRRRVLQRRNIARLVSHGANLVVGSDWYERTARGEVDALRSLGLWTNLGIIRMWAVATPRSIFPRRRIGALSPGYEASFLVLRRDPIRDFDGALASVAMRVKQGCVLSR
jgi:imidazolonepropionase-like amidohydrolase